MYSPSAELAAAVQRMRDADVGRAEAARRLRGFGLELLRRFPADEELFIGFSKLRDNGFVPPRALELPAGGADEVRLSLESYSADELSALAATLLNLPEPSADPEGAARVLELLILVPAEHARARSLIARAEGHVPAGRLRLAELSLALGEGDPDLEALLEPLRGLADEAPRELGTALRLAASHALSERTGVTGGDWLHPVLGGRRVANMVLALRRRPALRDELDDVVALYEEADRVSPGRAEGGIEGLVSAADSADARGDFEEGTARLERALERSGERVDLAEALMHRAAALLDPTLAERAARTQGVHSDEAERRSLTRAARARIAAPEVSAPASPESGWTALVQAVGSEGEPADTDALAFLEAAGASERAARGHLAAGDLLQTFRLVRALGEAAPADTLVAPLVDALRAAVSEDEAELADAEGPLRDHARALWHLLPEGVERRLLGIRLRATGEPAPAPAADLLDPGGLAEDDPHSPTSRLAAGIDLFEDGRYDAAGAIVAALLRHPDDAPEGLDRLAGRLLSLEDPPLVVVAGVERALKRPDAFGERFRQLLLDDPLAAFPLHEALLADAVGTETKGAAAVDVGAPDALRVAWLQAWLGIWAATGTAPGPESVRPFMKGGAIGLLPLAAARLSGAPDPVARAAAFLAGHDPHEVASPAYAEALVALAAGA